MYSPGPVLSKLAAARAEPKGAVSPAAKPPKPGATIQNCRFLCTSSGVTSPHQLRSTREWRGRRCSAAPE
jgi:hypothetical protein